MKSIKRVKGFTLVELIVVIAIIGVLTGVLIPNAVAWIRDSKLKTCNSEAKIVFNTAVTVLQDYQLEGKVLEITSSDGVVDLSKGDAISACDKITQKLGSNFSDNSQWYVRAEASNVSDRNRNTINVISALYSDTNASQYIGRYPVPATKKYSSTIGNAKTDTNLTVNFGNSGIDPLID